jgi:hypothetical protein
VHFIVQQGREAILQIEAFRLWADGVNFNREDAELIS